MSARMEGRRIHKCRKIGSEVMDSPADASEDCANG